MTVPNSTTAPVPARFGLTPALLLRLEGLGMFAAMIALYIQQGGNGWLFAALLLAPDLSMVGYLLNPRWGASSYNLAHTYLAPGLLAAIGLATATPLVVQLAIIWAAHIGMDRTVGYGLKYTTAFKDTHLNRV